MPKGEREREGYKKSFIIGPQLQFLRIASLLLPSSSQQNKNYKRKIAFSHRNCQQPSFCLLDLTGKKDSTMVNMAFLFFPELFEFAKDSTNYLERALLSKKSDFCPRFSGFYG